MGPTEVNDSNAASLIGRVIGTYRIEGFVGAGGMGEIYRARDTRLGRDVAIKILPRALVDDPERLARFEREARILASLNHPNIATIHSVEESDGLRALVLELIAGQTLSDRLRQGELPLQEALKVARQIAEALDAAHEKGIVHRDVKPANIMLTPSGLVKVLDFGIAAIRLGDGNPPEAGAATRVGAIRGTAPYMSPEQARGAAVDKRTDIWAFGCVLYEMLTGRSAFERDTMSDTLAAILEREPNWSALPSATPPSVARLVRRCLEKDPRKRIRDIGDVLGEIDELATSPHEDTAATRTDSTRWKIAAAGALVIAGLFATFAWLAPQPSVGVAPPVSTSITLPANVELNTAATTASLALSPDGRRLAYIGVEGGRTRLYLREIGEFAAKSIDGTEGARYPFFSPDGQWIAFFTARQLKRVAISGGAPIVVCDVATVGRGGTWGPDGDIVFPADDRLVRVRALGGSPEPIVSLDPETDARRHTWPQYLPDGAGLLSTVDLDTLVVFSFSTRRWRELLPGSQAQYLDAGYLVFHALQEREGQLNAVPFDLDSLSTVGPPVSVLDGAFRSANAGAAFFAIAPTGTLAFAPGGYERTLVRVDRQGRRSPLIDERRGFRFPRVSPDGQRVAVTIDPRPSQIWVYDLTRGTGIPLSTNGHSISPTWTPDGQRVAFSRGGIEWAAADGREPPSPLIASQPGTRNMGGADWSSDGQAIVFSQELAVTGYDVWIARAGEEPRPLFSSPGRQLGAKLSPDSRWLAYQSDESGRTEVYVRPFPNVDEQRWTISTAGGWTPVWAPDGREIFYMNGTSMMAVPIETDSGTFSVGKPELLFDGPFDTTQNNNFDMFPDGDSFLMVETDPDASPTKINLVQNWAGEVLRIAESTSRTPQP